MVTGLTAVLVLALTLSEPAEQITGTIEGVVVNASQGNSPLAQAEVILQVQLEGEFAPVEKTRTDARGRFRFENLPVGSEVLYLPGATRDEIFYPGRRIELSSTLRTASVPIAVHDTVRHPNPLVIRQHEVVLRAERGVLQVVEAMLIDNPGNTTYIGSGAPDATMVSTFRLGIPMDFSRLTFEKEFYGRQFHVIDGQVLTTIPWTPGDHWLRFTYTVPNQDARRVWEHPLDIPCDHLVIRVRHERPEEIVSNLGAAAEVTSGEARFEFRGQQLAGQELVKITLGPLPRPWTFYARWTAVALLTGLVTVTICGRWLRQRRRAMDNAVAKESEPAIGRRASQRSRTSKIARHRRRCAA